MALTEITKTIGDGSTVTNDYSTIQAAANAVDTIMEAEHGSGNKSLVTYETKVYFDIYPEGTGTGGIWEENVNVATELGVVTSADYFVTFRAVSGEGHDGTSNSGVRIEPGSNGDSFTVSLSHTHFENLEVMTGTASSDECFDFASGSVGVHVENCILEPEGGTDNDGVYMGNYGSGSAAAPHMIRNCLCQGFDGANGRAGIHHQMWSASGVHQYLNSVNNTFIMNTFGIGHRIQAGSEVHIKIINCVGGDNTDADFGETGAETGTLTYTSSSDNFGEHTGTVGSSTNGSFPDNTAVTVTDSTAGGGVDCIVEDFTGAAYTDRIMRMVDHANNDAQDAGVGPSSETLVAAYDCVGNTRQGTTTDPGFHQVTTYGATATTGFFNTF